MNKIDGYLERYLSNRYKNVSRRTNITQFQYIPKINYEYTMEIEIDKLKKNFKNKSKEITELLPKVAYFSCGISRYEILNRYKLHTFNPTARNLHSTLMYLFVDDYCFRYNYLENRFEIFRVENNKAFNLKDKFYIVCCNELFALTSYYGEFAYLLAGLDAGHLMHNIKLILSLENLQANLLYDYNHKEICELIRREHLEVRPFFILEVDKKLESKDIIDKFNLNNKELGKNIKNKNYFDMKQYKILCDLLDDNSGNTNNMKRQEQKFFKYIDNDKILSSLIKRTSAHNLVGNICFELDNNIFKLSDMFSRFIDYKKALDKKDYFKCYFIQNKSNGSVCIIDENKCEHVIYNKSEEINFNIIHDNYEFFQTHTFSGLIILTVDINAARREHDLNNIYLDYSLLISGDLMQCISLLVAEEDYFCRPIKNYNDDYIHKLLDERNEIMYVAAIGKSNNANTLAFNIL